MPDGTPQRLLHVGHAVALRPPAEAEIAAPEFTANAEWVNVAFLRMDKLLGQGAVLVEFFDCARINSHRTSPYLKGWHERYRGHGLRVVGIHSPGYSFGREREHAERAIAAMGIEYGVLLDPDLIAWRVYDNRGWPARYLFDASGILRYVHYGEGDYADGEAAIREVLREIDADAELPEPLGVLRSEDDADVLLEPQTAEVVLPNQSERVELVRDWTPHMDYLEAADAGAAATVEWTGSTAYAVLSGAVEPGLYETDGTVLAEDPGLRLHGFQFLPRGVSAPAA